MSLFFRIALVATTGWLALAPAVAQADARKIIEQAAAAHGGTDRLKQFPAAQVKVKGAYIANGQTTPYSSESTYWLPDRLRTRIEYSVQRIPQIVEQTLNGERTAMTVCGLAQQMTEPQAQELKLAMHCRELERLAPLLTDSKYKLTEIGEKTIHQQRVIGIRVARAGFPDVTLYFDPATHLLHSLERPGIDAKGGKVEQSETFLEYKQAGGIRYPAKTRVRQNGQIVLESEVVEFTPFERVDAANFAIPQ